MIYIYIYIYIYINRVTVGYIYSLNIILFCFSIYAIKTRKLPDNFNESKLIFLHVLATSFLWIAFLPSYFAAEDSRQKAGLLAMLLLISGTLTTLCLYAPKVSYYINVEQDIIYNKVYFVFSVLYLLDYNL